MKIMLLENELQQSTFKDDHQKMILNIIYTANWLYSNHTELLKPYDISPEQYNILRILRGQKGQAISAGDIQSRMLNRMSNVSRLIEKLRRKKLVERKENPLDRRAIDVTITNEGLEILNQTDSLYIEMDKKIKQIVPENVELVNSTLDMIRI